MAAPLIIEGYKFFNSVTGENIIIKGIDYYPRPNKGDLDVNSVDFFTEKYRHIWERDIVQFQSLGINAVRLYSVDPYEDHSAFMCALNSVGIYALVSLAADNPEWAVSDKKAPYCYPRQLKRRGETIIREFSKYTNTLAFSAGNEVNHFVPLGESPEWNAPCLKKFMRDMRAYTKRCTHMRHVPLGVIMADSDRDENTLYYNCQSDPRDDLEYAEWYGINTYVFCDGKAEKYEDAKGFKALQESFKGYSYSIPVLLTEFGCLSESFETIEGYEAQRNFNQAKWFSLPQVQITFSGGLAFEYSMEAANAHTPYPYKEFGHQNYGIGYFAPSDCDDLNVTCEYARTPSFYNLKNAYENVKSDPNITLESFSPEKDRTGRSKCPTNFPPLHTFRWENDYVPSIGCPKKSAQTFSCASIMYDSVVASNDNLYPPFIIFICVALLLVALVILIKKSNRGSTWGRKDKETAEARCFKIRRSNYMSIDQESSSHSPFR